MQSFAARLFTPLTRTPHEIDLAVRFIEEAQLSEARKRFGRLDSSRSTEGAGPGLALVVAIAQLHDGALVLEHHSPGLIAWIDPPRVTSPRPA